jgi:plastocyanin domain-containing protein
MRELLRRVTTALEVAPVTTFRLLALAMLVMTAGCKNEQAAPGKTAAPTTGDRVVELKVTEEGFEPTPVTVKKGEPLLLKVTRTTDKTCATEILIAETDINVPLPLNQTVEVRYTPNKTGQIQYGCAMGMMISGVLVVE